MVCPKCGNTTDGLKFCPRCGTKVFVNAPQKKNAVAPVQKKLKSVRVPSDPAKANISLFFAVLSAVFMIYPFFVCICFSWNDEVLRIWSSSSFLTWLNLITLGIIIGGAFSIAGLTRSIKYEKQYEEYTSRVRAARTISTIALYYSMISLFIMSFIVVREYVVRVLN